MPTQYSHSREESAALLKRVIAEMGQHDAPFDPTTYAVWYEHTAGINPGLSRAMIEAREKQPRLGPQVIAQIFRDHVAEADAEATQAVRGGLDKVMGSVVEQADATGRHASVYGGQLAGLQRVLKTDETPQSASLAPHLDAVADGTQRMQEAVADLARAVAEGRTEIDRLHRALDRSRTEAITDPLSQLLNRKGFDDALRRVLGRAPAPGRTHCLVMMDIDHFKRINDAHGHPVGDSVIQALGQLILRVSKGPGVHAARVGGEEFAVLMADTDLLLAMKLAESVLVLARGTKIRKRGTQETVVTLTVSAGVAAHVSGADGESLLAAADAALYRSKADGRDRMTVA